MPRSSAGARPTAARTRSPSRCRRSAPTAPGSPPSSTAMPARARSLESTNREIARRLDAAMENIRSVLDAQDRERVRCAQVISMAQVNVTINGRQFRMACEDGQEDHLLPLAKDLDQRIVAAARQIRRDRRHAADRDGGADDCRRTDRGRASKIRRWRKSSPPCRTPAWLVCRPREGGRRPRWSPPSTRPPSASRASPREARTKAVRRVSRAAIGACG